MDKKLREALFQRSGGYCELCGGVLPESWALHHRKLKSQGGKDELSNIVALHHECHNLGTDSVHLNPAKAVSMGFIVPSWDTPEDVLICTPEGGKVRLLNNGTIKH
jgi:hypothetical protein